MPHQMIKEARYGGLRGRKDLSERTTEMNKVLIALGASAALSVAAVVAYRIRKQEENAAASSKLPRDLPGDLPGDLAGDLPGA